MLRYKKYKISDIDNFRPDDYPKVINELADLRKNITGMTNAHKEEILISYLKKMSLKPDWIMANPEFTGLIKSGVFATGHLESLFDSCQANKQFQQQYEDYIRDNIL